MVFRMELWNNGFPDGEQLSVVDLPEALRGDAVAIGAARDAVRTTGEQMLRKLGAPANLEVIFIPDAMTNEEIAAAREAHRAMGAGRELPDTDQVLNQPDL